MGVSMADSVLHPDFKDSPYWWEALDAPPPPADPPPRTEVAIVGGGYTGLSAALTLARAGREAVVLEAEHPGWGASSRNAGLITKLLHTGLARMEKHVGTEALGRYIAEASAAFTYTTELIEREQIACHLTRPGRFVSAPNARKLKELANELELARRYAGATGEVHDKKSQRRELGSDHYAGGIVIEGTAAAHPALYAQGLARRAENAGATLAGGCRVTAIRREGNGFRVETGRGAVQAEHVIVATNAYTGLELPQFRHRIVPIAASMIATEPLSSETIARLLPTGRTCVDNARTFRYWRRAPTEDRLLFGGLSGQRWRDGKARARSLHAEMTAVFPDMAGARVTHAWSGQIALSMDHLPHLGVHDGIHYALAMCGTGLPMGTWLGHRIALRLLGEAESGTVFDTLPFKQNRLIAGNAWFAPAAAGFYRFLDLIEP